MKLSFKLIIGLIVLCVLSFNTHVYAESITLPNGQKINIDNLTEYEVTQAIKTAQKSMEGQKAAKSVLSVVKGVDPT